MSDIIVGGIDYMLTENFYPERIVRTDLSGHIITEIVEFGPKDKDMGSVVSTVIFDPIITNEKDTIYGLLAQATISGKEGTVVLAIDDSGQSPHWFWESYYDDYDFKYLYYGMSHVSFGQLKRFMDYDDLGKHIRPTNNKIKDVRFDTVRIVKCVRTQIVSQRIEEVNL